DTTLTGAQVSGDKVVMDVGRNLTLTSEQDSDRYDSRQQNASAGGSFTFGSMSGSASVNLSKDKMHSNYDSVAEQTGIFAGKGGYDITVGEHTQLNGAVIGSTATADKNRLDTGTLGWGDIDNRADFKTEHQSVGFSSGGSIGSQFAGNMANGLLTGGNNEGHDSTTTHAAVSDGTLIVRDQGQQTQDTATLSHDVEHANQTLSPIFDKEKEQQRLQQTQLIGEIGNQVADIARTEGQISAINAGKAELAKKGITEPEKGASKEAWERYNAQLAATDGYKAAQQQWGTGSSVQQAIQAATAAVQGLAGGDMAQAIAGGAAPYVAEKIHQLAPDEASRVMAHAIMAGIAAELQGNSAAAGAAGAATAAIGTSVIAKALYGTDDYSKLNEIQKQTISTLGTLTSGLAGGLVGGNTSSVLAGGQTGKNTVENNDLGNWGSLVPPRVQQDASLALDQAQNGKNAEEISNAIDASHMGPSWGVEYKVKPNGKIEVSGGMGLAMKGGAEINNDYLSVSTGYTPEFGVKAGASMGIDFGPYYPGVFGDLRRDYSTSIGFGPGSVGVSAGKDGIRFSFSVGPSIGFTGSSTAPHGEKIELNGDTTKEIYHHDFK
ncbi:TPA: polymorphic toxin type 25 domain-containing protein, partial [Raoultella planticola]